ncbi:MAG: aminotransferase class III-fold pyridoxal phosphate-dependent enzyme, partial [Lentisphaeria bacterium]|nr:aminotransferase class III-fold pyridoxal phosphate-dependent enzyme [Lentisphaeria bacterium]
MSALYDKTVERFSKYVVPTYAPKQLFVRGEGARLWDDEEREFLDFASGISVCNVGHCNKRVAAAIAEQSLKLVHTSNLYYNELMPRLAEKLITESFPGKVFFSNSGAEANEGMIKLARKYGNATGGRNTIISMNDSFHGRTLATLAATGRSKYRKGFEPDVPGFKQVPFNDIEALKTAVTPDVCAVMLEMVQGEGGILPADPEYLKQV